MREILFKAKKLSVVRAEGSLVCANDPVNTGKTYILPGISDFSYGDNGNRIRIGCFVEVCPSTVCQYHRSDRPRTGRRFLRGMFYKQKQTFLGCIGSTKRWLSGMMILKTEFFGEPLMCGYIIHGENWRIIGSIHDGEGDYVQRG